MPDSHAPTRHAMAYQEVWGPDQGEEARATVHLRTRAEHGLPFARRSKIERDHDVL